MILFKKFMSLFKKEVASGGIWVSSEDTLCGQCFKHYRNEKIYEYLFVASPEADRSQLVVVYQDIESKLIYTRPWNDFFSSVGTDVNRVPRFKEQL